MTELFYQNPFIIQFSSEMFNTAFIDRESLTAHFTDHISLASTLEHNHKSEKPPLNPFIPCRIVTIEKARLLLLLR